MREEALFEPAKGALSGASEAAKPGGCDHAMTGDDHRQWVSLHCLTNRATCHR